MCGPLLAPNTMADQLTQISPFLPTLFCAGTRVWRSTLSTRDLILRWLLRWPSMLTDNVGVGLRGSSLESRLWRWPIWRPDPATRAESTRSARVNRRFQGDMCLGSSAREAQVDRVDQVDDRHPPAHDEPDNWVTVGTEKIVAERVFGEACWPRRVPRSEI